MTHDHGSHDHKTTDESGPPWPRGWVVDPVCHMPVDPARTRHKTEHEA